MTHVRRRLHAGQLSGAWATRVKGNARTTRRGGLSKECAGFPDSYERLVRDVQLTLRRFVDDRSGHARVMEVEFPVSGLDSVAGDGEGCAEMSASSGYLSAVLSELMRRGNDKPTRTRVLFPDKTELLFQKRRRDSANSQGEASGGLADGNVFNLDAEQFRTGFLTDPSPWLEIGWDKNKKPIKELVGAADDDDLYVAAYPHFNINETLALRELDEEVCEPTNKLLLIFNGELDRFRGNYYPSLFYPKAASLSEEWLPRVETLYYIHNFRGAKFGSLFRCFPGDWEVLRRKEGEPGTATLIASFETRPSLADVAEIIRQS